MIKTVNLGYKYRLYPTQEQMEILNHQMFVYNQTYNICLNLWQKENSKNKDIDHGKMVKQKSGLNRTILNASFYQFVSMIEYKQTMLNDKLFVKVNPAYTSQECSQCGNRDKANRPKQDKFKCTECGYETNPDIQAAITILNRGLESFGLGISLVDSKHKAFQETGTYAGFRSTSLEVAS